LPSLALIGGLIFGGDMSNKKRNGPPFVMLERKVLASKEWRTLKATSRDVYIQIKANYNGSNNGKIPFKYSEITDMHSSATIKRALDELIAKGWITKTKHGGLYRYYCEYRLTWNHDVKRL